MFVGAVGAPETAGLSLGLVLAGAVEAAMAGAFLAAGAVEVAGGINRLSGKGSGGAMHRGSTSYLLGFAFGCLVVLVGLFAVAIFAESPYSIVALCLVPVPFIGIGFAVVARGRNALAKLRSNRRS